MCEWCDQCRLVLVNVITNNKLETIPIKQQQQPLQVRVIDFGSACYTSQIVTSSVNYLQSRYYRLVGWKEGLMDGWKEGLMDGWMDGRKD